MASFHITSKVTTGEGVKAQIAYMIVTADSAASARVAAAKVYRARRVIFMIMEIKEHENT